MPVIAYLESTGGITACGGNAWGYASCTVRFGSFEEGAAVVAASLSQYGNSAPSHILCVWVSGGGCSTHHAVSYVYRAAPLWAALGGWLGLPPMPPDPNAVAAVEGDTASITPEPLDAPEPFEEGEEPPTEPTPGPSGPSTEDEPAPEPVHQAALDEPPRGEGDSVGAGETN
jgi:hypothetical protein